MKMQRQSLGCCDQLPLIDFTKIGLPDVSTSYVKLNDLNFWFVILLIVFNPLFWNLIGRWELRSHRLSWFFGSGKWACVSFGLVLLTLGLIRFCRYKVTIIDTQPRWYPLQLNSFLGAGYVMIFFGLVLLLASFWALGFYKAHLGECFGICGTGFPKRFPYNIFSHPMYISSILIYAGYAFIYASQAGLWLTLFLALMYIPTVRLDRALQVKVQKSIEVKQKKD